MRRMFALTALLFAPLAAAQEPTFDLIEAEGGVAALYGHGLNTFGLGGVAETKVNVHPHFAFGIRAQGGVQGGGQISTASSGSTSITVAIDAATLAKAEFYLAPSGVRPFVGLGVGAYWLVLQSIGGAGGPGIPSVYQSVGRHFGLAPQIGLDFGKVRLSATYHAILGGDIILTQSVNGSPENVQSTRNYVALELSFRGFGWTPPPVPEK
jgi:hypothetical protein